MLVDDIGLRIEPVIPHPLEQHAARHHPAGIAQQDFEDLELAAGQPLFERSSPIMVETSEPSRDRT